MWLCEERVREYRSAVGGTVSQPPGLSSSEAPAHGPRHPEGPAPPPEPQLRIHTTDRYTGKHRCLLPDLSQHPPVSSAPGEPGSNVVGASGACRLLLTAALRNRCFYPHFAQEGKEAELGEMTCPEHAWVVVTVESEYAFCPGAMLPLSSLMPLFPFL